MRRYAVVVTKTAEDDLAGIADYLSSRLGNSKAAIEFLDDFEHLVGSLETLPSAHAVVRDELLALAGYRWSAVGSYMAFFTIDEESSSVNVERVLHGRMNWREIV